jgi:leucyl-tRNA synthetase
LNIKNLSDSETTLRREVHLILKQANFDYARMQYNTVVSACMKLLNAIEQGRDMDICLLSEGFGILLRVLYPMVPHITYCLWQKLGYENIFGSITDAPWPKVDETALVQDELKLMLQVNGKLRGDFMVPASANKDQIEELALASEVGQRILSGVPIKKWIVVPGRLVNVVI